MKFRPNKYQEAVFDHIEGGQGNIVVEACAGSGKTVTILESLKLLPQQAKVIVLAFNKSIQMEMESKAPDYVEVRTFHSLGLSAVTTMLGRKPKVNIRKISNLYHDVIKEYNSENKKPIIYDDMMWDMKPGILKFVNMFRATLLKVTMENLKYLSDRHEISFPMRPKLARYLIKQIINEDVTNAKIVDFDDMIYIPVNYNLSMKKYDYVYIDETQDLNSAQLRFMQMLLKDDTMVIAVGDRNQALYGFRGADTDAMPNVIRMLKAKIYPLSITYRCPLSHVAVAKEIVPEIEAAPNAIQGEILNIGYEELTELAKPGDLCLCRNNAPLIQPAFHLLRTGHKVIVKGNDIGAGLIALVDKFRSKSIPELQHNLEKWKEREVKRLEKKELNPGLVHDKYECVMSFIVSSDSVRELKASIRAVFGEETKGVTFSSVHRAKGLEADNVFLIYPHLMPSVYATQEWSLIEEENIRYVALTRSKNNLYIVGD